MGIDASLTVVPRREYRKYRANPSRYVFPTTLPVFYLWQEYVYLDMALERMTRPLDRAVWGNQKETDDEVFATFVTPAIVKKIHHALDCVSDADFINALIAANKELKSPLRKREH